MTFMTLGFDLQSQVLCLCLGVYVLQLGLAQREQIVTDDLL